jgi:hypothetical protein
MSIVLDCGGDNDGDSGRLMSTTSRKITTKKTSMTTRARTTDDLATMGAGEESRTWRRWRRLRQGRRLQMITAGQGA